MSAEAAGLRVRSKVKALAGPDFGLSDQGSLHFPSSIRYQGNENICNKSSEKE